MRYLLGAVLPHLEYGACEECRRPWWATRGEAHVWFSGSATAFALCRPCWAALSPLTRFERFSRLVDRWERAEQDCPLEAPRETSLDEIRARLARAILVEQDPQHWAAVRTVRPVIGAPPRWWPGRR